MLGFNMYAYCGNNPVMHVDYTGEMVATYGLDIWLEGLHIPLILPLTTKEISRYNIRKQMCLKIIVEQ